MCFHSKQSKSAQEVANRFNASIENMDVFLQTEHINGYNFTQTPVITNQNCKLITNMHWGLIPTWAKDESIRSMTLNARIETIEEKPAYKQNTQNRCLIIADGFYEWKWLDAKGKLKDKYLITLSNEELYSYAGIYSNWTNPTTGEEIYSYAMVTTQANELMSKIHNIKKRMPIILQKEHEALWLEGKAMEQFAFPYEVNLKAENLTNFEQPTLF